MPTDFSWERLKQTRPVRVLGVYLGASWIVLSGVETLQGLLSLPDWVGRVTIGVLGIGLVVVGATAWIQSLESTTAAEDAGELPSDWEIAPGHALASLRDGRMPHLNWGRVVLGGVVSLSLTIGVAGAIAIMRSGAAPSARGGFGVEASEAPSGIAVLPFTVQGPGLDLYSEAMVSFVSTNIDGVVGFRSINPRSVHAAWRDAFGDETNVGLDEALAVAASTGARYALVGDASAAGTAVRMTARLYDLSDGTEVGVGRADGQVDQMLELIDEMSVNTLKELMAEAGRESATEVQRLAALVTRSIPALNAYLEGDAAFREGRYRQAIEAYERAVEADTAFAMAWSRMASAYSWSAGSDPEAIQFAQANALAHVDRLPREEVALHRARVEIGSGIRNIPRLEELRRHVETFPDDAEVWNAIAEILLHLSVPTSADVLDRALLRPVELDPGFEPYYSHLLSRLIAARDKVQFDRVLAAKAEFQDAEATAVDQAGWDFFWASPEAQSAAGRYFSESFDRAINLTDVVYQTGSPPIERLLALVAIVESHEVDMGFGGTQVEIVARVDRGVSPVPSAPVAAHYRRYSSLLAALPPGPSSNGLSEEEFDRLATEIAGGGPDLDRGHPSADSVMLEALRRMGRRDGAGAAELMVEAPPPTMAFGFSSGLLWGVVAAESLALSGDLEGAIDFFERVNTPFQSFVQLRLGELYEETGDAARAREHYARFLERFSDADSTGAALLQRGRDGLAGVGG